MVAKAGSPEYRMWLFNQYHHAVRHEVVPAIRADMGGDETPILATGASIGAFNSLAVLCRFPDVFRAAVGMSGTYRIQRFLDHQFSQDLFFASPLDFLPGLEGEQLDLLRTRFAVLASGQGAWEDVGRVVGRRRRARQQGRAEPGRHLGRRSGSTTGPPGSGCCRSTSTSSARPANIWKSRANASVISMTCCSSGCRTTTMPSPVTVERQSRRGAPTGSRSSSATCSPYRPSSASRPSEWVIRPVAAGALEDRARVVPALQRLHRPVDDGLRPAGVGVAVRGEVHHVDDAGAGRAGADLAEHGLAVGLAGTTPCG